MRGWGVYFESYGRLACLIKDQEPGKICSIQVLHYPETAA